MLCIIIHVHVQCCALLYMYMYNVTYYTYTWLCCSWSTTCMSGFEHWLSCMYNDYMLSVLAVPTLSPPAQPHCQSPFSVWNRTLTPTHVWLVSCCLLELPSTWTGPPSTRPWLPSSFHRLNEYRPPLTRSSLLGTCVISDISYPLTTSQQAKPNWKRMM